MAWTNIGQRIPSPEEIAAHLQTEEVRKGAGLEVPESPALDVEPGGEISQIAKDGIIHKIRELRRTPTELRKVLDLILQHYDVEPMLELVKMGMDSANVSPELRAKIWMELQSYRMPKLKSIEHSGTVRHQHNVVIVRFGEDGKIRTEKSLATVMSGERVIDVKASTGGASG